jgi:hypothetical protein
MPAEFTSIYASLCEILKRNAGAYRVKEDTADTFWLETAVHPQRKMRLCAAGVKIGKAYVSYHLMPVYGYPKLLDGISAKLKARMQGKSCFNFKVADEALFQELEELTARSLAAFTRAGYVGDKSAN